MRDTARKRAILHMLENHNEFDYREYGPPPYTATAIAERIGGSVQSVARTLRGMAAAGLLVSVRHREEVWNAIAQAHIDTTVTAYYSASTMEADIAKAKAWNDGAEEHSNRVMAEMMTAFSKGAA